MLYLGRNHERKNSNHKKHRNDTKSKDEDEEPTKSK
jgi:hypothetical protein